jgi:succinate-semialdehyde dehydrogenase/glutarate-semialdehyde dehydrogenase
MFTGSVPIGKKIMELASRNLTNLTLELGGKDPMIILKDADLDKASRGAVWAAFMNAGQSCGSVERVYVAKEIADEFTERVLALTRELKVGNPLEPGTDMGPMANPGQLKVVEEHIQDAEAKGARLLCGGRRMTDLAGYFIQPAVLTQVDHSMKIMTEETFGPALPIMTFSGLEEALALANDSPYGLTASVWTTDKKSAVWMADRLEAGTVTMNDHMITFVEPKAIWGGIKQTGLGRSHGPYGLHDLVNIKYVCHDFTRKKTQLWWFPYDKDLAQFFEKSLTYFHHDRLAKKAQALLAILPQWSRIWKGSPVFNFVRSFPRLFKK